jgi:hypothetical protein
MPGSSRLRGSGDSKQGRQPQGAQFIVAPPQHRVRLYFLPEPHGHASLRPSSGAVCRGSPWAVAGPARSSSIPFAFAFEKKDLICSWHANRNHVRDITLAGKSPVLTFRLTRARNKRSHDGDIRTEGKMLHPTRRIDNDTR